MRVVGGGPGEKAGRVPRTSFWALHPRRWLPDTEIIGPPDCPILHRWTLLKLRGRKVILHHFLPNADDRAEHDHPAPFTTIVLYGYYVDVSTIPETAHEPMPPQRVEAMRAGMIRRRRASHRHVTKVGPRGCWTLVIMGRKERPWGFWKDGHWWEWRDHERLFGYGMRCPGDKEER